MENLRTCRFNSITTTSLAHRSVERKPAVRECHLHCIRTQSVCHRESNLQVLGTTNKIKTKTKIMAPAIKVLRLATAYFHLAFKLSQSKKKTFANNIKKNIKKRQSNHICFEALLFHGPLRCH